MEKEREKEADRHQLVDFDNEHMTCDVVLEHNDPLRIEVGIFTFPKGAVGTLAVLDDTHMT